MLKFFFPDLRVRAEIPELMDLPDSDEQKLFNTLSQFSLSNLWLTRSRGLMLKLFLTDMQKAPEKSYTLLDLGAGGCDLPLWFSQVCLRTGLKLRVTCLELDPRTAAFAREKCRSHPELEVKEGSALDLGALPAHDYIFANHFLHHLPSAQIPALLDLVVQKTKRQFLLNDLRRLSWAYAGFTLLAGLGAHDSFTFYDGRVSLQKAFTMPEMQALLARCQSRDRISISTLFPARLILSGPGTQINS